jgi:uncharacterized phage protein (TIGR02218 family)
MNLTTHNGEQFFLLDWLPNWSRPYRVTLRRPVHVEQSVTAEEIRRGTADTLRVTQEFRCILQGDAARDAEETISTLTNEVVAVPFWPALAFASSSLGPFRSGAYLAISEDFLHSEVFDATPPDWCYVGGMVVPLLFGRLNGRAFSWDSPTQLSVSITHIDAAEADRALTVDRVTWDLGPFHNPINSSRRALFPLRMNWTQPGQNAALSMETAEIGFGRGREEVVRANPSREFSVDTVAASRDEIAQLVAFFFDHSSELSFWIPSNSERFTLESNVQTGRVRINQPGHGCESGDWLAFSNSGKVEGFGRVAVADESGITLGEPCIELRAGETLIQRLAMVRFRSDRLTIDFDTTDLASAQCEFVELEPETDSDSGRTGGVNIGTTMPKVWLYQFTVGDVVEQWTSHESSVVIGTESFAPARINHGDIVSSINGSRDSVSITIGINESRIVLAALGRMVYGRVKVEIVVADRSGGEARGGRVVFAGEVESLKASGATATLSCKPWPGLSEVRIGRFRIQPTCNHILYSEGCGILTDDLRYDAVLADPGGTGWPFVFGLTGLARHAGSPLIVTENWFAGGWMEVGTDKVQIRASAEPHSGVLNVTMARDPNPFPNAGSTVRLYPGCDGRWETCRNKFSNGLNFGGHPHIPVANPSLVKLSSAANGGKK